jgi:cysteine desulfurase
MVYLDAASTEKYGDVDNIIVDTIALSMRDNWGNPSSLYSPNVKDKINKCRNNIAEFVGAKSDEIYFTSGASESNSWAVRGFVDNCHLDDYKYINVITTPIEHKSILNSVNSLSLGAVVHYCGVDEFGFVDCRSLELLLDYCHNNKEPVLVSVCMANNEIGTIQPIKEIAKLTHKYDGVLHVDATQCLGHIPINVEELGVDMMSCSGHKVSPVLKGIGFLYKKRGVDIQPLIHGAQENGLRGGTENTYGIIGLNKAIEYCNLSSESMTEMCRKRDYFFNLLKSEFGCKLNGHSVCRLPNNLNVTFPQNIMGESLLYMLDICDIKISTGSACNSKSVEPSHVLKAIGVEDIDAMKSVRFTLPSDITYDDINYVINEIGKCIKIIESN